MEEPYFLTLAEVIEIHKNQLELYGGNDGVRDIHLLQSALAQPESSFGGVWPHPDLYEMAATYAFHLSQNHPFIDGNKRTALSSGLVFLEINGISVLDPSGKLYDAMMGIAEGRIDKPTFAKILKGLSKD